MKRVSFLLLAFVSSSVASGASDWKPAGLPAYARNIPYVAIGGDGLLYEVTSNRNGYVFTSILETYRFQPSGNAFAGEILAGKQVTYLGASCDASTGNASGTWSVSGTGLDFAVATGNDARMVFRLLSTGLTPSHSC
ncbi:hypothetical protein [Roseibium aggregatum]|uniref:Secreted protein n=1 Tax=Roseibium aggregatum TaxID=187304 RepID=A0A939J538_9HYPH|nr:hypothetical protein [Roseibium aggregatum]MBN9671339.1 hypothetical protein [Roseibium aggregatum]